MKMGKRARLLCSKLRDAYGSPGAVLAPPVTHSRCTPYLASVLESWRYPVQRLDLSKCSFDATLCNIATAVLPALQELRCLDVVVESPDLPHPSLTYLHVHYAPQRLRCIAAFAPHLRTLHIKERKPGWVGSTTTPEVVWEALAALSGLKSLHLPLSRPHLAPSTDFCSTLQHLTALTHLGVILEPVCFGTTHPLPSDDAGRATRTLGARPLLASVDFSNFWLLGNTLGSALQALPKLRILALDQRSLLRGAAHPPGLRAGCLPSFSAMRSLEELTFSGDAVVGSEELRRALSGGSPPLKALALEILLKEHVPEVCDMLAPLTALTSLNLQLCSGAGMQQEGRLPSAIAQLTQLQCLKVHNMEGELFPCLASLVALTCLEVHRTSDAPAWPDVHGVQGLSCLRRLVLRGKDTTKANRSECLLAGRELPLLEDVEVGRSTWTGEDLALLLPPPELLKRLVLTRHWQDGSLSSDSSNSSDSRDSSDSELGEMSARRVANARGVAAAVERLESYGIWVIVRGGKGDRE